MDVAGQVGCRQPVAGRGHGGLGLPVRKGSRRRLGACASMLGSGARSGDDLERVLLAGSGRVRDVYLDGELLVGARLQRDRVRRASTEPL